MNHSFLPGRENKQAPVRKKMRLTDLSYLCLTDIFNLQILSPRPWRLFLLFLFFLCALDLYRCFHWKETITHSINSLNTDDEEVLTAGNYNCAYFALIRPISIAQRTVLHSSRCSRMGSQKEQIFILCTASLFLSTGISYHRLKMSSGKKHMEKTMQGVKQQQTEDGTL